MSKTIQQKLDDVLAKKKVQSRKESKKKEVEKNDDDMYAVLGIPKMSERIQEVTVYKIAYHNRARLDHTKYPSERVRPLDNSPMFATYNEADEWCKAKEKEDKENLYWPRQTGVKVTEVSPALIKKLKKRGWGFH